MTREQTKKRDEYFSRSSQLIAPLVFTEIDGKPKTLYMTSTEQMRELTQPYLRMTLQGKTPLSYRLKRLRPFSTFRSRFNQWHGNACRWSCARLIYACHTDSDELYGDRNETELIVFFSKTQNISIQKIFFITPATKFEDEFCEFNEIHWRVICILDLHGMTTTVDTFLYLQRDIEQSFYRLHSSSFRNQQDFDQLLHHISCTLDDLQEVHRLLPSTSTVEHQIVDIPEPSVSFNSENELNQENSLFIPQRSHTTISITDPSQKGFTVGYSRVKESSLASSNTHTTASSALLPSFNERKDFIRRMQSQLDSCRHDMQVMRRELPMETIRLDPTADDESEDRIILKQDEQLDGLHHSIVSLKNLTQNINFEIDDHLRVLDNLESSMITRQNGVESLTKQTKHFIRNSGDGVGGHTCLFAVSIGLFFLIVILILFFW